MNDEDLKKIKQVVSEVVKEEVSVSEKRLGGTLEKRFTKRLKDELSATEKRIYVEIGQFIEESILTQLEEKADKSDIERIERKLDNYAAESRTNSYRLDTLESLPTIAHELKLKKRKK